MTSDNVKRRQMTSDDVRRRQTMLNDASNDERRVVVPVAVVDEHPPRGDEVGAEVGVAVVDEPLRASNRRT